MKRLFSSMDKPLLIVTITMLIFGLLMIFSASNAMATVQYNQPYKYLIKQGFFIITSIIMFLFLIKIPSKNYSKLSILGLSIIIILLFGLDVFGVATRSSKSWIPVGPFSLQPSEFCKAILIIYMATYYEKVVIRNKNDFKVVVIPLMLGALCFILTAIQPDFGTAIIIFGIVFFTFIAIPINSFIKKKIYQYGIFAMLLSLIILLLMFVSNNSILTSKIDRFNIFNPCTRYQEASGYQVCNGYIAINNGGIFGVGLGNSTQKYLYLPEAHTDFIFPIIIEELGLIVGVIILFNYLFILWRIIKISQTSTSLRGSIMAYGVAIYIFLHIIINLTGVLGILPLTGVPLPFLSYGGSNLWTLIIGLTIVQRIEIEKNERIRKNIVEKGLI